MKTRVKVPLNIDDSFNVAEVSVTWELKVSKDSGSLQINGKLPTQKIKMPVWDESTECFDETNLETREVSDGNVFLSTSRSLEAYSGNVDSKPQGLYFNSETKKFELWVELL